jgi:GT2 family glycosyltransferase
MKASISFTTYSDKTELAEKSLFNISLWKNNNFQLMVACHDCSNKMKKLLQHYKEKKVINDLFFTPNNFGHLRGVNLCLEKAKGKYFFNINHDILVKNECVINDCIKILDNKKVGMVGWFWVGNGCFWKKEKINFTLRSKYFKKNKIFDCPLELKQALVQNKIKNVIPGGAWAWCCNTSFFGIKTKIFKSLGGFNTKSFEHKYADDYLTYQIIEKRLDVLDMPKHLYKEEYFDCMTRCKWHDLGIKIAKKESRPINYLTKFL